MSENRFGSRIKHARSLGEFGNLRASVRTCLSYVLFFHAFFFSVFRPCASHLAFRLVSLLAWHFRPKLPLSEQLLGLELFLNRYPEWRGKVTLIQVMHQGLDIVIRPWTSNSDWSIRDKYKYP